MAKEQNKYVDRNKAFFLHPNVQVAYENYTGDADEFVEILRAMKDGHREDHDEEMAQTAYERTMAQIMAGNMFPQRRKR